jgi:hypothetical protein
MTDDEFAALLQVGHETPGMECKGPGRRDDSYFFALVTKGALAMSNRRDGGDVIIGVVDQKHRLDPVGLEADELATWTHDLIADGFKPYADPGIAFTKEIRRHANRSFVVLRIQQFRQTPVICTKTYQDPKGKYVMREGALYVRDGTKAETIAIATHSDLRDLLELATERRLRALLGTVRAAGVDLQPADDDDRHFKAQRSRYSGLADKSMSRGGWITVIRPAQFISERVELGALLPLMQRVAVKLRGWDFPHVDPRAQPIVGLDHIEEGTEWEHHLEWWRLYQSAQFVDVLAFDSDWRDQSSLWPPEKGWKPGEILDVVATVFKFTEIFEVAARMAANVPGDDDMHVSILGLGLKGRLLTVDDPKLTPFSTPKIASLSEIPYEVALSRRDLMSDPRGAAIKAAVWFLERFGWSAGAPTLQRLQDRLPR